VLPVQDLKLCAYVADMMANIVTDPKLMWQAVHGYTKS